MQADIPAPAIAIVEDEYIVALDIRNFLERLGYRVAGLFPSGDELISRYEELRPDLVLMDISIKGSRDGLVTASYLREKWGTPVILLTAYADEDPFLRHNALVNGIAILAARGQPDCVSVRDALAARGHADLGALGSAIFLDASHAYLADHGHDLLPDAPAVLRALLAVADVVFCTNFTTDAVARSWAPRGFAFAGPDATPGLTLRGEAQKQTLTGDPARTVDFGGRPVAIDRAHYRAVLERERPDVVVGDVFSLDLALPLALAADGHAHCRPLCLLARTRFTPGWSLGLARGGTLPGLRPLDALGDLVPLVAGLAGRTPGGAS